jgi:hypothetical protein
MRLAIHRPERAIAPVLASAIVCAVIVAVMLVVGYTPPAEANHSCSGVHINPGNDLDAIVNSDPSTKATTFCVHAPSSGATYTINNSVILRSGDKLIGQPGQIITRGPASYGVPPVKIRNGASLPRLIDLQGSNVVLRWLDIAGANGRYITPSPNDCTHPTDDGLRCPQNGTGLAIGAATADATLLIKYLRVHHNEAVGIASMNGKLLHSNLYNNGTNPDTWAWSAGAVKGVDEYEAAYNYVHDNPANGLWCDYECQDAGTAMPNGFWVHDNLLVNNGRWGVRYEYSPIVADGVHSTQPTALIEYNEIHANGYKDSGYGGASMYDAQNATFRNNVFGPKTIAGVSYGANTRRAIFFGDSESKGRERTDLWNGDAVGNTRGGETIEGCAKPDNVVYCANNR